MEEIITGNKRILIDSKELSSEELRKLVSVFDWLIQQDKKQNLSFYNLQLNKI